MSKKLKFLIVDGYPKPSRDQFDEFNVKLAGVLYAELLQRHLPDAEYKILFTSDPDTEIPDLEDLKEFDAVLWPGCNLTVYHNHDERVTNMTRICNEAFELGLPQFGSCWAAQLAVYVAGGEVAPNVKGREMGLARKVYLNEEGKKHPMYEGKPPVFDGFISHDDIITKMPEGAVSLAANDFTPIQSVDVTYKNGVFWAPQYHPEYDINLMAGLIAAREEKLTREGYFRNHDDLVKFVSDLRSIAADPSRKDLRWKYGIDDDVLSDDVRELEFANWIKYQILKKVK